MEQTAGITGHSRALLCAGVCVDMQEMHPYSVLRDLLTRRGEKCTLTSPLGPASSFEKWKRLGFTSVPPGVRAALRAVLHKRSVCT